MLAVRFEQINEKGECIDYRTEQFEKESDALNYLWEKLSPGWRILFIKKYH